MGDAGSGESLRHDWLDTLVAERLPVLARVPHVEVAKTGWLLDRHVREKASRRLVAEPRADLRVDVLTAGGHLRNGVSTEEARDVLWVHNSVELWDLLRTAVTAFATWASRFAGAVPAIARPAHGQPA